MVTATVLDTAAAQCVTCLLQLLGQVQHKINDQSTSCDAASSSLPHAPFLTFFIICDTLVDKAVMHGTEGRKSCHKRF